MRAIVFTLCLLALHVLADEPYVIPRPSFEVFRPRGFRVSIPDSPGLRMFAFHGAVNRRLHGLENGDLTEEVYSSSRGRWTYNNRLVKLEEGNVINYWLFVIRGNLGYRIDDQQFVVTSLDISTAPPGFLEHSASPPQQTTPRPSAYPTYRPVTPKQECNCNSESTPYVPPSSAPPGHIPLTCYIPDSVLNKREQMESSTTTTTTTTTSTPTTTTNAPEAAPTASASLPADLGIWRDLLTNLSSENKEFRDRVNELEEVKRILLNKLTSIGDENINKLTLSGRIPKSDDPLDFVKAVFREKLGLSMNRNIRSAVRNADGSITFEMATFDDKLRVLLTAKEKLQHSRFTINDVTAVSFMDTSGKQMVDQRNQEVTQS